ncbi:unnamed protein product [Lymnaea stagnalis]|uniref:Uncharacterized protein n=1 Tax=Lymnaea stagnalis TaxID=6523 RepID=A0AAV2HJM3_LYMST
MSKRSAESTGQHQHVKRQMSSPTEMAVAHYLVNSEGEVVGLLQPTDSHVLTPTDLAYPHYLMPVKEESETRQEKTEGTIEKPSSTKVTMQQFMENEMKNLKEQFLEEKQKDRQFWVRFD